MCSSAALNPQFTGDMGACVVISETIFVMLATHSKFREFTPKAICDTTQAVEVLINLSCESRQEVNDLVAKAIAAGHRVDKAVRIPGGSTYDKAEDFGFMMGGGSFT